jgi:phage terminase large subunit-like protein
MRWQPKDALATGPHFGFDDGDGFGWGWLFLGGRGTGKSHSMSAAVHMAVRAGISRIHLIAPTTSDFQGVNLEGRSGILATCGRDPRPAWVSSKPRLEWPNGAVCVFFSAGSRKACAVRKQKWS